MSSTNGKPPRITSASASSLSRSSRVPWPLAFGPRYRADVNAGHVSRISPSNQPPASVSRIAGSTASIRARSAALVRCMARMLIFRMDAPCSAPRPRQRVGWVQRSADPTQCKDDHHLVLGHRSRSTLPTSRRYASRLGTQSLQAVEARLQGRILQQRLAEITDCLVALLHRFEDMRASVEGRGIVGSQLERALHVGHGLDFVPGLQICPSPTVVGLRVPRIEADRLAVVRYRAVEVTLAPAGNAAIEVGRRVFRVQLYCLAAVGNGRIIVALRREIGAAAVVSERESRIELDCLG